jgi:hypothetical protein
MTMTPDRWERVRDICHAVLDDEESRQPARLTELCAGDAQLKEQVIAMIADAKGPADGSSRLDRPAWEMVASSSLGSS